MNYLIVTSSFNDAAYLLYALQDATVVKHNRILEFIVDDNHFYITKRLTEVPDGVKIDKKILCCHNDWRQYDQSEYDQIVFVTPGESIITPLTNNIILEFLNKGNLIITASNTDVVHDNFISDYSFNLYYLYFFIGYHFLNYYQNTKKESLLGVYYTNKHISNVVAEPRTYLFNKAREILQDDLCAYATAKGKNADILNSYEYFGLWERNHVCTYTDLTSSTCNLVFETLGVTDENITRREHMTEKTLKSIIFSEENMFTLWYGSRRQYLYLIEKGFWFLNFEFYEEDESKLDEGETRIRQSIINGIHYLKELKEEFQTNEKVHEQLLKIYGHKLKNNVRIFKNLMNNCEMKDKILSIIKIT